MIHVGELSTEDSLLALTFLNDFRNQLTAVVSKAFVTAECNLLHYRNSERKLETPT